MSSALRNFALTFVISLVIFGILAFAIVGFVFNTMFDPGRVENPDSDTLVNDSTGYDDTTEKNNRLDDIEGSTFNILLIGSDFQPEIFDDYDYEERWTGSGFPDKRNRPWSADMIIVLRIDKENGKFILCPIPSNTRVRIEGESMKLGDVICEKSLDYFSGKVSELTGLSIDYYAHIPVGAIAACVDSIGSISFTVPQDMHYEDPEQGLIIDLQKGLQVIDGEKAAQLLRYVGYSSGDTGRTTTVINFMKAMMKEYLTDKYLSGALILYAELRKYIETNFTSEAFSENLDMIFSYSDFETSIVNYPGSTRVYGGITYFEPSTSTAVEMFRRLQK